LLLLATSEGVEPKAHAHLLLHLAHMSVHLGKGVIVSTEHGREHGGKHLLTGV